MAYQYVGGRPFLAPQGAFTVVPQQLAGVPLTTPFRPLVTSQPMAPSMMSFTTMDQAQQLTASQPLVMASLPGGLLQAPQQVKQEPLEGLTMTANPYGAYAAQYYDPQMLAAMGSLKQEDVEDRPKAVLDDFNSDLNLSIDPNGLEAQPLTEPMGFCFCWAGARATYGVTNGKVCFEVYIAKHLPVDFGEEHKEQDPHVARIGWSVDSASFQLGEVAESFGYGGTAMFSVNMRFSKYGKSFGEGDTIMALLDLESTPPNLSFMKNGHHLGMAHKLSNWQIGVPSKALFPHILSKNTRFEVNFGQQQPRYPPPAGFMFLDDVPSAWKVKGMEGPTRKSECEMIMIVGLPGAGKTTWGIKMQAENPEKRYNIIGTDTLIDKMRVNGLPRKNNYHGRWEVLIQKATSCLNTLFTIGSRQCRNYILDQTNVYASARRRKLKNFEGFRRILAVVQPDDAELKRREYKRTYEDGKFVPEDAVMEMKANFVLPYEGEQCVDEIVWVELAPQDCSPLVKLYNNEGRQYKKAHGGGDKRGAPGQHNSNPKRGRYEGNALDYLQREYNENPTSPHHQNRLDGRSRQSSMSSSSGYVSDLSYSHEDYKQDQWAADRRPPSTWQRFPGDQQYSSSSAAPPWSQRQQTPDNSGNYEQQNRNTWEFRQEQSQQDSFESHYQEQDPYGQEREEEPVSNQDVYAANILQSEGLISGSLGQQAVVMSQPLAAFAHPQGIALGQPAALGQQLAGFTQPLTAAAALAQPASVMGQPSILGHATGVAIPSFKPQGMAAMTAAGAPLVMTFGQPMAAMPMVIQQQQPALLDDKPRKERKSRWAPADEQEEEEKLSSSPSVVEQFQLNQPPPPPPPGPPNVQAGAGRGLRAPLGQFNSRPGLMGAPPPFVPNSQSNPLMMPRMRQPPSSPMGSFNEVNRSTATSMQNFTDSPSQHEDIRASDSGSQNDYHDKDSHGSKQEEMVPRSSYNEPPPSNVSERAEQQRDQGPPFHGPPPQHHGPPPQHHGWGMDRGRGRGPRPPFRGGFGRGGRMMEPGPPPRQDGPPMRGGFPPMRGGWGGRGEGRGMPPRGGPGRGGPRGMPPPRGMHGPPRGGPPFRPFRGGFRGH